MSAEPWPTEEAATKAVEAAARKVYETDLENSRQVFPPGVVFATWEQLSPNKRLEIRQQVLPVVWAALEALSDPRHAAWANGYHAGVMDEFRSEADSSDNPYPSGL